MRKIFLFIFLLFIFLLRTECKEEHDLIKIEPGTGVNDILIGMNVKDIIKLMGEPVVKKEYSEAKSEWETFGYDINESIMFFIGFDYYLEFNESNKKGYPIWKIFFENDEAVIITVTSYIYDIPKKSTGVMPSCFIWGNENDIINTLGDNYFKHNNLFDYLEYYYMGKGILFFIKEGYIRVIMIYKKLTDNEASIFKKRLIKKID